MKDSIEDGKLVEEAGFTYNVKFSAMTVVASLRYLRELALQLGISMEDIRPQHIIDDLRPLDRQTRELNDAFRTHKPMA